MSEDANALPPAEDEAGEDEAVARVLALVAGYYGGLYFDKQPLHTSVLQGSDWVAELMEGNPTRMFSSYRMTKPVFRRFCTALSRADPETPWSRVSVEEKAAIFLYCVSKNASNSDLQERFQHSGETIYRYVLNVLCNMASKYLVQPNGASRLLQNEPKYAGQFDQCRLAFDGTHILAYVPSEKAKPFRDRTGKLSQNVFAACTFDMQFAYVLSGWEAADSTVLADARLKGFSTPPGLFDLGDARYGLTTEVMTPYRGVRPQNYKELYNLRHAQARNVIERTFGVLKRRFPILKQPPEYSVETQAKIVRACCVLHNFIRIQKDLPDDPDGELKEEDDDDEPDVFRASYPESHSSGSYQQASNLRDQLAQNMWDSYVVFQRR
ncbi:unnamed protein product [Phytophthora fragariaefolia]|uniref:Unnamed protein product n=1 Tax=Phytophthora fragariaefolia TaxID=1490495 RepID=A0A9W6TSJ4_9STRA|nr:unnamed protein product [Phytophthora fragariaefolia]